MENSIRHDGRAPAAQRKRKRLRRYVIKTYMGRILWKILRAIIIFGLCFTILYPFFTKFMTTFKSTEDLYNSNMKYIPMHPTLSNVKEIIEKMDYWNVCLYTAGYCLVIAVIQTMVSMVVAYGFARFRFKGSNLLFALVILTLIVPPQTTMMSIYTYFRFFLGKYNLVGTLWPPIILAICGLGIQNGLYIFLMRQFLRNLPKELEEAAYIDGYNLFQTFLRIILPSSVTMMTVVFVLSFCWQWTDTVYSGMLLSGLPLMANRMNAATRWGNPVVSAMLANSSAVFGVLPLALLYICLQNLFIQGIERSGITG